MALPYSSRSDSPVTNTPFYQAYLEFGIVVRAESKGYIDDQIADYLLSPKIALDLKAAIINALSFEILGKDNADRFIRYLNEKYQATDFRFYKDKLTADELFCLGYLKVMDDYFSPEAAIPFLEAARQKLPNSYIVNIILAITKAQAVFNSDKCKALKLVDDVRNNQDLLIRILPEGKEIIYDYFEKFRNQCI